MLLAAWSASPWARFLEHGGWTQRRVPRRALRALPAGGTLVPALAYAGGWLLMLTAMMLPTALPVLAVLERMTAGRRDGRRLVALAAAGYLAIWGGFGLAAHLADAGVVGAGAPLGLADLQRLGARGGGAGARGPLPVLRAEAALPRPLPLAGRRR